MTYSKVQGHSNLYRDEETGAIVNVDHNAYTQYISSRNSRQAQRKEIDEMKQDISEIKSLLKELLNEQSRRN